MSSPVFTKRLPAESWQIWLQLKVATRLKTAETLRVWHLHSAILINFPLQLNSLLIPPCRHPGERMLEAVRLRGRTGGLSASENGCEWRTVPHRYHNAVRRSQSEPSATNHGTVPFICAAVPGPLGAYGGLFAP